MLRCLSCTTRAPRGQERDGVDYFFLAPEEFARRAGSGEFLEHATVFGKHSYGTPRAFVEQQLAAGRSVIKDVDVQGAAQIRRTFPAAVQVFVAPSSRAEIERRLRGRGTDSDEVIARRLAEADAELARWRDYDYLVVNDDLGRAVDDLAAVLRAAALRIG
jgi:guanylate kinase